MSDHVQLPTTRSLTTFHLFRKLPWELRHEIWNLAVRPFDRPGAHIFCIEERKPEDSEAKECDVVCDPIPLEYGKSNLHITVPATTISSGATGNPSTYIIDGGLWTTCKESRAVMEKAFKHQMWDPKRRAYPQYHRAYTRSRIFIAPTMRQKHSSPVPENPYAGLEHDTRMVPATGFFLSASSSSPSSFSTQATKTDQPDGQITTSPHYFSVFPHQDLFIIRPSSWEMTYDYWSQLERGFPFGSKEWGYFGVGGHHGLAFEYDPVWSQESEATPGYLRDDFLFSVVGRLEWAINPFEDTRMDVIWLVDYRLKLKQDTPADKREPSDDQKVFYGNDGRRYVEMYSKYVEGGGDRLQWFYTEGIEGEDSSISEGSCHSFIAEAEVELIDNLNGDSDNEWGDQERVGPKLGLLACLR